MNGVGSSDTWSDAGRILVGYVWTGKFDFIRIRADVEIFGSAKKNLRIQKYPKTCGRGLIVFCGSSGYPVQLSERPKNA